MVMTISGCAGHPTKVCQDYGGWKPQTPETLELQYPAIKEYTLSHIRGSDYNLRYTP